MHILSNLFRIVVQIAIAIFVPGGILAVIIYQFARFKKRRAAKNSPAPSVHPTHQDPQPLPQNRL